jgi:MoxR-like ATPase
VASLQSKFHGLANQLKAQFFERESIISGMLCAAIAGEHVLLLGQPGTAKSALVRSFCGGFSGAFYFEWLLSKYSVPEELFGPLSLAGLKRGIYSRVTTGKLPEAEIVFLDEIFKSNSGVLNSLLSAINERKFHDGNAVKTIPLRLCVGASNELPDGAELAALYDRFLVRYWVEPIKSRKSLAAMLVAGEQQSGICASLKDWTTAQDEARQIPIPAAAVDDLLKLKASLEGQGVTASDRRWKRVVGLLRANAWLSEDNEVSTDHFEILADCLWSDPATRPAVAAAVAAVVGSAVAQARRILDTLSVARQAVPAKPTGTGQAIVDWQRQLVTLGNEASEAVLKLQAEAGKQTGKKRDKIQALVTDAEQQKIQIRDMLRDGLGL